VFVDALRIDYGISLWNVVVQWTNFNLVVRDEEGQWHYVGQANTHVSGSSVYNKPENWFWIDMGGMKVTGVMLYGANEGRSLYGPGGNNPNANVYIAEMQVWGRPVPEPATMTLLALGGLALLRRGRR